jgi:hypothetical protein
MDGMTQTKRFHELRWDARIGPAASALISEKPSPPQPCRAKHVWRVYPAPPPLLLPRAVRGTWLGWHVGDSPPKCNPALILDPRVLDQAGDISLGAQHPDTRGQSSSETGVDVLVSLTPRAGSTNTRVSWDAVDRAWSLLRNHFREARRPPRPIVAHDHNAHGGTIPPRVTPRQITRQVERKPTSAVE